jgi:hypothetical protein
VYTAELSEEIASRVGSLPTNTELPTVFVAGLIVVIVFPSPTPAVLGTDALIWFRSGS